MDELLVFPPQLGGGGFQRGFDGFRRPRLAGFIAVGQGGQFVERAGDAERFLHGFFFKSEIFGEEETDPVGDFVELLGLLFDDRQHGLEGFRAAVVDARFFDEREAQLGEPFEAHADEILDVDPVAFVEVKRGVAAVELGEIEELRDFGDVDDLAVVLGRPAEQTEVVANGFRGVAFFHIPRDGRALVALAHL